MRIKETDELGNVKFFNGPESMLKNMKAQMEAAHPDRMYEIVESGSRDYPLNVNEQRAVMREMRGERELSGICPGCGREFVDYCEHCDG